MKPDLFEAPDYYNLDELLTEEHKLVRDAAREWVKRDVSPIIEEYAPNQQEEVDVTKKSVDASLRKRPKSQTLSRSEPESMFFDSEIEKPKLSNSMPELPKLKLD
mgnify:CR=1 FL=1